MMDFVAFTRAGAAKRTRPMNRCDTCTRPENHSKSGLVFLVGCNRFPSRLAYNSPSFSGSGCRGRVKRKLARWKWCAPTRHRACSAPILQARVHDAYEPRPSYLQDRPCKITSIHPRRDQMSGSASGGGGGAPPSSSVRLSSGSAAAAGGGGASSSFIRIDISLARLRWPSPRSSV
jgi:uncharacterized membrane protein YgcG